MRDINTLDDGTLNLCGNPLAFSANLTKADNDTMDLRGAREAPDWDDFQIAMAKEMEDHR
jgi:hypothetical protein